MKKLFNMFAAFCLCFALFGCSSKSESDKFVGTWSSENDSDYKMVFYEIEDDEGDLELRNGENMIYGSYKVREEQQELYIRYNDQTIHDTEKTFTYAFTDDDKTLNLTSVPDGDEMIYVLE